MDLRSGIYTAKFARQSTSSHVRHTSTAARRALPLVEQVEKPCKLGITYFRRELEGGGSRLGAADAVYNPCRFQEKRKYG
jgi:hypothetical protein